MTSAQRLLGVLAGPLATLALSSSALAGPTVKVRVEGESATLLGLTTVTLGAADPSASGCPVNSANAAINLAVESVGGTWDHGTAEGSDGDFTQTILGETHKFENNGDTWAVWIDDKWGSGICEDLLSEGDEVLMVADHEPEPNFEPTVLPLVLENVPGSSIVGVSFTVTVDKIHTRPGTFAEPGEGTPQPEAGVTVSGAGSSATTNAQGNATLTISQPGNYTLSAREPGAAPPAPVSICVRASGESGCGTQVSSTSVGTVTSATGTGASTPYTGPFALVPKPNSIIDSHVYKHGQAPRTLSGSVLSHTTVTSVSLELRREYRHRCYAYDGVSARFQNARCGHGEFFKVSNNGIFSYLLPKTLAPGRYVMDIEATDAAGNHTTLARGTSRMVFYVAR